ncbi:type I restriction endonuclease subunit R [Propionibacteriaceae bacterium Y1685]
MTNTTEATFEGNIEAHLVGNRWGRLDPSGYDLAIGLFPDEVIEFVKTTQPKAWKQLCDRHSGESMARKRFLENLVKAIDHRGTVSVLRGTVKDSGVTVRLCWFKPANTLAPELIQRYEQNRCAVVRQLHHSESRPNDSLDLVLVVNGIPVATAELKNQLTGQGIEHAMTQYRKDRNPHDKIFTQRTLVHFAVDPHQVAMTTKLDGDKTRFLPFNQGTAGPGNSGSAGNPTNKSGYQTSYLWEQVWQRDAWLELLGTFVHESGGRVLFPRFHQWHAVRSILNATRKDGAGIDRLIQHSAGSGKSNTIAWSAHSLSRLHDDHDQPIFDKVVVITDRKVLDKQLQDTVAGLDHTPGTIVRVDQHSSQLKAALEGNAARIVITTLQKFPVVAALAAQAEAKGEGKEVAGHRFAIIVDEAHSSTSGDAVKQLKKVLGSGDEALEAAEAVEAEAEEADPNDALFQSAKDRGKHKNLSFFAFTATPKPKTLSTFGTTGPDGIKVPFHTYSMRQAIDEGFILDVLANYTTYATYYKLATSHPRNDPELDASKGKSLLARFASLHPYMMDAKAEVIVEHFRQKTASKINGNAKAMVVTRSRLHAVRTKEAIDGYIKRKGYDQGKHPLRALVAFSGTVADPDAPDLSYAEAQMNGFAESQLPKRFREDFQVLVVAEKYQTGFDEPLLHTMYVDKKLSGVKAVQTLSRLNRTHPGKEDTFVLDFANTAEEIQDSFADFYEQSLAQPTDPNALYTMEHDLMAAGVLSVDEMDAATTALLSDDPAQQSVIYTNIGSATGRYVSLDEDAQEDFRGKLQAFCRAYAFVAQVMPWADATLERLFLFGKLLFADLPASPEDPMPQVSKSVQLTHLRLAVTSEGAIALEATGEPGQALPGEGKGASAEPVMDKLSALVAVMNEKYGADLGEADKIWVDQQWTVVMGDEDMQAVATNNDRSQYQLALADKIKDLLLDRHEKNSTLFEQFFANPEFQSMLLHYLGGTYDEFRAQAG